MRTVLHAGCGSTPINDAFEGWKELRLDIDPSATPDILAPITKIPLPDESVDAVYTSHTLEHVYYHEALQALKEFRRVLKPDGYAVVIVPDVGSLGEFFPDRLYEPLYQSPGGPVCAADMIWGHQAWIITDTNKAYRFAHKFGYTESTLTHALQSCGFPVVRTMKQSYDLVAAARVSNSPV